MSTHLHEGNHFAPALPHRRLRVIQDFKTYKNKKGGHALFLIDLQPVIIGKSFMV